MWSKTCKQFFMFDKTFIPDEQNLTRVRDILLFFLLLAEYQLLPPLLFVSSFWISSDGAPLSGRKFSKNFVAVVLVNCKIFILMTVKATFTNSF